MGLRFTLPVTCFVVDVPRNDSKNNFRFEPMDLEQEKTEETKSSLLLVFSFYWDKCRAASVLIRCRTVISSSE